MAALRRLGSAAALVRSSRKACIESGSAYHPRLMSSAQGDQPSRLRVCWDTTRFWIRDQSIKYSSLIEEFKEADRNLKSAVEAGTFLYVITGATISAVIYVVDAGVDRKVDKRCKKVEEKVAEESKSRQEFQRLAVRDFQDHVSKIQNDVSSLREKVLDHQEKEVEHRRQLMKAAEFLKLHGYIVVSNEEFGTLVKKVDKIEKEYLSTKKDEDKDDEALMKKVDKIEKEYLSTKKDEDKDDEALMKKSLNLRPEDAVTPGGDSLPPQDSGGLNVDA